MKDKQPLSQELPPQKRKIRLGWFSLPLIISLATGCAFGNPEPQAGIEGSIQPPPVCDIEHLNTFNSVQHTLKRGESIHFAGKTLIADSLGDLTVKDGQYYEHFVVAGVEDTWAYRDSRTGQATDAKVFYTKAENGVLQLTLSLGCKTAWTTNLPTTEESSVR